MFWAKSVNTISVREILKAMQVWGPTEISELQVLQVSCMHYTDVIMGAIASQITSLTIVYSTINSDADQRKYHSSASLAFVWGIHRGQMNSPHKWPVTRKILPFDDVVIWSSWCLNSRDQYNSYKLLPAQQDINSHDIDYAGWMVPFLLQEKISITYTISVLRNERKCKWYFKINSDDKI